MAPIAGRPPYATDEPDSFYESPPQQPRQRPPPPQDPNKRTSAYDVYDNYVNDPSAGKSRVVMNQYDDDERYGSRQAGPLPSKHAALAAATREASPPPQYIAAPRPGYAAPIAALNLARPEAAASPAGRQPNLRIDPTRQPQDPFQTAVPPNQRVYESTPSPISSTPHPLQPPVTPITPVFARPAKAEIKFSDEKPILRGNTEETLLPKRGEHGDDFWRRFSMVAKEESRKPNKQSQWLSKTQNGLSRLSRWVWIIGIILLLVIGGAVGLGWYITHDNPDHYQPKAVGGSAEQAALDTSLAAVGSGTATMHVSPTNTVARRAAEPMFTPVRWSKRHLQQRMQH